MKKIAQHILVVATAFVCMAAVQSCSPDKPEPDYKVSVNGSENNIELNMDVTQTQKTFKIASEIDWTITAPGLTGTDGGWYTISAASGKSDKEIAVDAKANTTGQERTAILTVKGKNNKVTVTVKQAADGPTVLEVDKTSLSFTVAPTAPEKFNVTAAALGFTITTKDELPVPQEGATAWYTITPMESDAAAEISVTAAPNTTGAERSVTLVVTSPTGKTKEVKIDQVADGPTVLEVDKTSLSFTVVPAAAEKFNVTAAALGFTITTKDGGATPWWTITPLESDGPAEISVTATPNATGAVRSVTIVVTSPSGKFKEVKVEQVADGDGMLGVSSEVLPRFEVANAPTQTFNITSPFGWIITFDDTTEYGTYPNPIDSQWATVNFPNGDGNKTITITAKNNSTGKLRTGQFTIKGILEKTKTVTISQASDGATVLELDKTSLSFSVVPTAPEKFNVTAALGFIITKKDEFPIPQEGATPWYKITPMESNNNAEISVTATPNATGRVRSVTLEVTSPMGKTREINIDQAADGPTVLEVDKTVLSFKVIPAAPEKFNVTAAALGFTITTKDELPAGGPSWYTITPMKSDVAKEISVTATTNTTGAERSVTLVLTSPTGKTKEVKVKQSEDDENLLVLSTEELTRFAVKDPTPQSFEINTLLNWTVTFEDTTVYDIPLDPGTPAWASANITSGSSGRSIVIVSVKSNDSNTSMLRSGKFTITSQTGKKQTVAVSQLNTLNSTFATNFLNWCLDPTKGSIDSNGDGFISTPEALSVNTVKCADNGLGSLKGIGNFPNLENLQCRGNGLNELDLKQNTLLGYFDCGKNNLTTLDMTAQKNIYILLCYSNQLTNLHVSSLKGIFKLNCKSNNLTSLNVSLNANLSILNCQDNNNLGEIDIRSSSFEKLTYFTFFSCAPNLKVITWHGFNINDKPANCDWQYSTIVGWSPIQ